jgi:hypothetical protein
MLGSSGSAKPELRGPWWLTSERVILSALIRTQPKLA